MFEEAIKQIKEAETVSYTGKIENIVGMSIEASGGRAAVKTFQHFIVRY